jgi:hypothetical protein
MDKYFTWVEADHRQHFPVLDENKAKIAERESQAKERMELIEEIKNQKTYGVKCVK